MLIETEMKEGWKINLYIGVSEISFEMFTLKNFQKKTKSNVK